MKTGLTILNIVFILTAGFLFLSTLDFPPSDDPVVPGPAYWPRLIFYFLVGISLLHIIRIWFFREEIPPPFERPFFVALNIFILSVYFIMMNLVGFYCSTFAYLVIVFHLLQVKSWKLRLFVPLITLGLIYGIFTKLLMVSFPRGPWVFF